MASARRAHDLLRGGRSHPVAILTTLMGLTAVITGPTRAGPRAIQPGIGGPMARRRPRSRSSLWTAEVNNVTTPRGLSWRDGLATLIVAFAMLLTAAVIQGWSWPVVGSRYRVGGVVLFVVGLAACIAGGESLAGRPGDAFLQTVRWLSILAALLLLGCLIYATPPFFVGLAAFIVLMWLLATVHHLVGSVRRARLQASVG